MKYNLIQAIEEGHHKLLTFGGAFSNHIAATAYAGHNFGLKTIGIIRGEELEKSWTQNPTLRLAAKYGMQFIFVDRATYRNRNTTAFIKSLEARFSPFYLIPEGGSNAMAIKGCEEILNQGDHDFDIIAACVGTGGTLAGIINASKEKQEILGFSVLKGDFLNADVRKFANKTNWRLINTYHFGGYAKVSLALIDFINQFKAATGIPLDPVYTGKLLFGILDMVKNGKIKNHSKILAIHTGGLQGIVGMNEKLKSKKLPLIHL